MQLTTTLKLMMAHDPCGQGKNDTCGWNKLIKFLGDDYPKDKPIDLLTILESNGVDDCLWSLMCADASEEEIKRISVTLAIEFARNVLPIFEKKYPNDKSPREAIEAAENWLKNPTEENRQLAADAYADADADAYADAYAAAYAAADAAAYADADAYADAAAAAAVAAYAAVESAAAAAYTRESSAEAGYFAAVKERVFQKQVIIKHLK
jgi:hypothetical protein